MVTFSQLSLTERQEIVTLLGRNPSERRLEMQARRQLMREDFRNLVIDRLGQIYVQQEIVNEIANHVSPIFNCLKRFANRIAVAYKHGVRRPLDGQSEEINQTWSNLLESTHIATRAKTWDRMTFALNTIFVLPVPYLDHEGKPQIRFDVVYGDHSEAILPPDGDPFGLPDVLIYSVQPAQPRTGHRMPRSDSDAALVAVDAEAWTTLDVHGQVLTRQEHGLGVFPGSLSRNTEPDEDYWDPHTGSGIAAVSIEAGVLGATMNWVRKAQNRKLLSMLFEDVNKMPSGQSMHPEKPIIVNDAPGNVQISIDDFDQPIENFERHYKMMLNEAAEVLGVPSSLIDPDPSSGQAPNVFATAGTAQFAALNEVRQDQIARRVEFDLDLQWKIALLAQAIGHEHAVDPDLVREHRTADFPPLPFIDSPEQRLRTYTLRTEFGVSNQIDLIQEEHPDWTREQSEEYIMQRIEERNRIHEELAKRNMPTDPLDPNRGVLADGQTEAQRQGREGGDQKESNRQDGPPRA